MGRDTVEQGSRQPSAHLLNHHLKIPKNVPSSAPLHERLGVAESEMEKLAIFSGTPASYLFQYSLGINHDGANLGYEDWEIKAALKIMESYGKQRVLLDFSGTLRFVHDVSPSDIEVVVDKLDSTRTKLHHFNQLYGFIADSVAPDHYHGHDTRIGSSDFLDNFFYSGRRVSKQLPWMGENAKDLLTCLQGDFDHPDFIEQKR